MSNKIDYSIATSEQIETALCKRLENIRLARNLTQEQLAKESGIALRTIGRLEKGQGTSLDTFIRVLIALSIQGNLETLLPDLTIRPIERVKRHGMERKRARPHRQSQDEREPWSWGDESEN